jgi:nucleoside-diphosphate-sugar epimerase
VRALVTGVAGFIGSTLARRLLADGHEVVGVDSLSPYYDPEVKRRRLRNLTGADLSRVPGDLLALDLPALLEDVDVVFHLAGQPGVRKSWGTEFATYLRDNVTATQLLLEAATAAPRLTRFIFASSSSVYGNAEVYPCGEEETIPHPRSPYGVTKLAAEHLCSLYAANYGVPTVSLRFFTVYGPEQRPDMGFSRFIAAAIAGDEIEIYGDGNQIRDFTYVDDIVAANLAVAEGPIEPGAVFNVSGGSVASVNEVLETIAAITHTALRIRYTDVARGDVARSGGRTDRLTRATGWAPRVSLRAGLSAQVAAARASADG